MVWTLHLPRQGMAHFITNVNEYAMSTYKKIKIKMNTFPSSASSLAIWDSLNYALAKPDQLGEATGGGGVLKSPLLCYWGHWVSHHVPIVHLYLLQVLRDPPTPFYCLLLGHIDTNQETGHWPWASS